MTVSEKDRERAREWLKENDLEASVYKAINEESLATLISTIRQETREEDAKKVPERIKALIALADTASEYTSHPHERTFENLIKRVAALKQLEAQP